MVPAGPRTTDDRSVPEDLRQRIAARLLECVDQIATDTIAVFRDTGIDSIDADQCLRIVDFLVRLLAYAVREGQVESRSDLVGDLHSLLLERGVTTERLFTFAYLTERTVLDELAVNPSMGATTEPWPLVAQLVRRASFDVLGSYTKRSQLEPTELAITDRLTTLFTRPLFDAVIAKELLRAGRFGYPTSLILFDVDRLSDINKEHGYGVGDKILERLGILIRKYFRQHDWVARYSEDAIAVLLPRTDAENAGDLAERVRYTVEKRLGSVDHRTDQPVTVTLSAAVVTVNIEVGDIVDAERLLAEAEAAVDRAKDQGRNRIVRVDGLPRSAV